MFEYMTVQEASKKWELSERRIQKDRDAALVIIEYLNRVNPLLIVIVY